MTERDRGDDGRARNARPRDELGRPLPHGAVGTPRVPEDLVLPPSTALREAQRLIDKGFPFHAHEVLEGAWKQADPAERELWQGLAQLAVGLTHLRRDNTRGAATLIERGRARISGYLDGAPHRIDVPGLVGWCDDVLLALSESSTRAGTAERVRLRLQVPLPTADGGEAVCWIARVCPHCGGLDEEPGVLCLRCGAVIDTHTDDR